MTWATGCTKRRTDKGLSHSYSRVSGWCVFGCGNRNDGRITNREGVVLNTGPQYSTTELAEFRLEVERELARSSR